MKIKEKVNPFYQLSMSYAALIVVVGLLSLFSHFTLNQIIDEQTNSARIINISGQQSMLSQRVVFYVSEYLRSNDDDIKENAERALSTMLDNHTVLLKQHKLAIANNEPSPLSPIIQSFYFLAPHNIDTNIQQYVSFANALLEDSTNKLRLKKAFVALGTEGMLNGFDAVVEQHEIESINRIKDLRFIQISMVIIIVAMLIFVGLFIIRPIWKKSEKYTKHLEFEVNNDYLTGLLNRRSFSVLAKTAIALSKRYKSDLSLVCIDIDKFKLINDQYGHAVGDLAIKRVSKALTKNSRNSDSVFRFGGEEFLMLLPHTNIEEAFMLAEKIRATISDTPLLAGKSQVHMSISAGVAEFNRDDTNIKEALKCADDALYLAKNSGRDKVEMYKAEKPR